VKYEMVKIKKNYPLEKHNTFHLDVKAKYFTEVKDEKDILEILNQEKLAKEKILVLGHGANILFSQNFDGLVLKNSLQGKEIIEKNRKEIILEIAGGEDWPTLVDYVVDKEWGGIENLALVPGTAGAAPVQNIACYGHNLEDCFISLEAINLITGRKKVFKKTDCQFAYRSSIFKERLTNRYLVTKIRLKLDKNPKPEISYHSRYESVEKELQRIAKKPYTIKDVYRAIVSIRKRKLPDIRRVGNAGSFFKNPVVSKKKLKELQKKAPGIQFYPISKLTYPKPDSLPLEQDNYVKVAAGWLLEEIGWKGKRIGNCGTWNKHALVVVNHGQATPNELLSFIETIRKEVFSHFGIWLENEVEVI